MSAHRAILLLSPVTESSRPLFPQGYLRGHHLLTPCVRFQQGSPRRKYNVAPVQNKSSVRSNPPLLFGQVLSFRIHPAD